MKDFEQVEKEANENVITISQSEFISKYSRVVEKLTRDLDMPMFPLLTIPLIAELTRALFDDEKREKED